MNRDNIKIKMIYNNLKKIKVLKIKMIKMIKN